MSIKIVTLIKVDVKEMLLWLLSKEVPKFLEWIGVRFLGFASSPYETGTISLLVFQSVFLSVTQFSYSCMCIGMCLNERRVYLVTYEIVNLLNWVVFILICTKIDTNESGSSKK